MMSLRIETLLPMLLFLEGFLGQQEGGNGFKTQIKIEENGMKYHQTVEYDPVTTAVTITVPKHGDISASTVIMHKPSNTQILMDPVRRYCQLKEVPAYFDPKDFVINSFHTTANNEVLSPERATEVQLIEIIKGKLSMIRRKELLKSIQDLCQDMPIFEVEEIDASGVEDENGFVTLNATHTNHVRKRRQLIDIIDDCVDVAVRCARKKPSNAHYCMWYITCSLVGETSADCEKHARHFHNSLLWSCATCCRDYVKRISSDEMCGCANIRTGEALAQCQTLG
jgi:hypothetical protein